MQQDYSIHPIVPPSILTAGWDHPCWRDVPAVELTHSQGSPPAHRPRVQARLGYTADRLVGIFRVEDNFVRAVATRLHGEVWKDSCVEFFFTPHGRPDTAYFNLEMNCCGVMLLRHQTAPRTGARSLTEQECGRMTVAASVRGPVREEVVTGLDWSLAFALPFDILSPYSPLERPAPGVAWRGNFYKCADDSSRPHWLTWSPIDTHQPDFHRPDGFGRLLFV